MQPLWMPSRVGSGRKEVKPRETVVIENVVIVIVIDNVVAVIDHVVVGLCSAWVGCSPRRDWLSDSRS